MDKFKPYIIDLLFESLIPIMFITEADMENFEINPVEYINKMADFEETMFNSKH